MKKSLKSITCSIIAVAMMASTLSACNLNPTNTSSEAKINSYNGTNTTKYLSDDEAKEMICEVGKRMYSKNFIVATQGNISCKVGDDTIWITPTGVSKGFLDKGTLIKMKLDGTIIEKGTLNSSSETKMHLRIYNENPEAMGIVHAHPPACTSFANAGLGLDQAISMEAFVSLGTIPCIHYTPPGSQDLADSVAPYCKSHAALLLANHGVVCWRGSLLEAFYHLEEMEQYATMLLYSEGLIGKATTLSYDQVQELLKVREKMGLSGRGGIPACVEEPTNLKDNVVSFDTIEQAKQYTSSSQVSSSSLGKLTDEDVDRIATAMLEKMKTSQR